MLPEPTPESQPFWDACARGQLVVQRCGSCGRSWFPPSSRCQHCWGADHTWTPVSGRGRVFSFTVFRRAYAPQLAAQLPYVVGVIELEEGLRLISNVVGCEPDDVGAGLPVEVCFDELVDGVALHAFRPRHPTAPHLA